MVMRVLGVGVRILGMVVRVLCVGSLVSLEPLLSPAHLEYPVYLADLAVLSAQAGLPLRYHPYVSRRIRSSH